MQNRKPTKQWVSHLAFVVLLLFLSCEDKNGGIMCPAARKLSVSQSNVSFNAVEGGSNPAFQSIQVEREGEEEVGGLSATVKYIGGQPQGWLSINLSQANTPAVLTIQAIMSGFVSGSYSASIEIASNEAENSPVTISVRFDISARPQYTLNIFANPAEGGSVRTQPEGVRFPSGTTVTLVANPNSGFDFTNWGGDSNSSSNPVTVIMDSDKRVTAHFARRPITVYATVDNTLIVSTTDPSWANSVDRTGLIGVGYNFAVGQFRTDFVYGSAAIQFGTLQSQIAGSQIASATLRLYPSILPADRNSTYAVNAFAAPWNSLTITANNQPNTLASFQSTQSPPFTTVLPVEFDVTQIVRNWANGTWANYGLLVHDLTNTLPSYSALRATEFESADSFSNTSRRPQIFIRFQ